MTDNGTTAPERDYDYSRLLDVHRWSDYPEVNGFIDTIFKGHFSSDPTTIQKKHLKVVLLDLYVAWQTDPDLCIALHMGSTAYKPKSRYNSLHISKTTIKVVQDLKRLGLIGVKDGFNDRREGGSGRLTRIWPTDKLIGSFKKASFSIYTIDSHNQKETIILRDSTKKPIEYKDTAETSRMRNVLSDYNALLADTHIDCCHLDQPYVERTDGKKISISYHKQFSHRVFNNESFKQGGRFYGGWWEQIGQDHRQHIRINGERCIEVDYSALHIGLLYAECGVNYWACDSTPSDPYDLQVDELADYPDARRWLSKQIFLIGINATNEQKAFGAIRNKASDYWEFPQDLKLTNKLLKRALDEIRKSHPLIADMLCSGHGVDLQYTDSQITENLIKRFTKTSAPILSVHDSYLVAEPYAPDLREAMWEEWASVTKLRAPDDAPFEYVSDYTSIKQLGYTDELEDDDPKVHQEILAEKAAEYVSPRYTKSLQTFELWQKEKGTSNGEEV